MTSRPKGEGVSKTGDDSTKALVIESVTMGGGGVKNYQKLRAVIYGRALKQDQLLEHNTFFYYAFLNSKYTNE